MAHFLSPTLSRDSLKNILKDLDSIPDEHRLKLWIGLVLNLPNNKSQYLNLRKLGKNIPCTKIYDKEEIKNKIICRVVQSLLAHCPTLKNFRNFNLAGFVEPFSVLLISHEFVYFEVMLTILVNWCQHWFDHIPLPPYTLLSMMDIIFLKYDPELYKHLASKGIRAIDYAWKWMTSSFTTIVDTKEWLILWDHILVNDPSFLYFIPLAACKLQSRFLLELSTHDKLMDVLCSTTPLDAVSLLKEAYHMKDVTPKELQLDQMIHPFYPLIVGHYPTLNPTDLITFQFDNGTQDNLSSLLAKVKETDLEVEVVIQEGMVLRKWMVGL